MSDTRIMKNDVHLTGRVLSLGEETLPPHDFQIVNCELEVKRRSGATDIIPVVIPKESLNIELQVDEWISVHGTYRSRNNDKPDAKTRLVLQVFSREVEKAKPSTDRNDIILCGVICTNPTLRHTTSGLEITDMMLAVHTKRHQSHYIPVIAWRENAKTCSQMKKGDNLCLKGRIQSRPYKKKIGEDQYEDRIAYEVSMMRFYEPDSEEE